MLSYLLMRGQNLSVVTLIKLNLINVFKVFPENNFMQ